MNLYDELELTSSCTEEDIKKQYRRLANIHHPDKGGNEEKFKRLKLAYEILSDPHRKIQYDSTGKIFQDPSIKSEALQQILHLLDFITRDSDPTTYNIIHATENEIRKLKSQATDNIVTASNHLKKLNVVKDKLMFSGDSENLILGLIENLIETKNSDIKLFKHRLEVCEAMSLIMKDYSYGFLALSELR